MTSKRHAVLLVLGFCLLIVTLLGNLTAAAVDQNQPAPTNAKIDTELQSQLANVDDETRLPLIVYLAGEADLSTLTALDTPMARRAQLAQTLQATAAASRSALQPTLDALTTSGAISNTRSLWLINALALTAQASAVAALAADPIVERIILDAAIAAYDPPEARFDRDELHFTQVERGSGMPWGVARVGAPGVWNGLGIDGSGVTVAIVDSGVDWQHPDLLPNYRGNLGNGRFDHSNSWFSPGDPSVAVPTDHIGHGTHVAGTAVGQNGIGVAPGAKWMAVNVSDPGGLIFISVIHEAFAWLLAPDGDPALAPDIINNSWGGPGASTFFLEDMALLQAAGIIPVFSAGNTGPEPGTVNAPASYTTTLAIGASDDTDGITWFSSRGPSPLTTVPAPWLIAPGANTLSAFPGGEYATSNGTSMAAPHASGAVALLLDANPALTEGDIWQILADTAVPISTTHPNPVSGWGRLDTLAAAATQVPSSVIRGNVTVHGIPAPAAAITLTNGSDVTITTQTNANGRFQATLRPGDYTISTSAYGALPQPAQAVALSNGDVLSLTLDLSPLPGGVVRGQVVDETGAPLTATVSVVGTPWQMQTVADGRYQFTLPAGLHKVRLSAPHHHGQLLTLDLTSGQTIDTTTPLAPSPRYLIVDTGGWYYESQLDHYVQSFQALNLHPDTVSVRNPFTDVPTAEAMLAYDAVVWSSPVDSPGYLGVGPNVHEFLDAGGNLLITGQNVGAFDSYGFPEIWWTNDLAALYLGKRAPTETITAVPTTPYAGIQFSLNGGTGADNQQLIDAANTQPDAYLTRSLFTFADGTSTALHAGRCRPFNLIYFGFGLEGVSDGDDRAQLLQTSLDTFQQPAQSSGLLWRETAVDDFILPGETKIYTLTLQNLSETLTDTISLATENTAWETTILTPTLTLGPCQAGQTVVTVTASDTAVFPDSERTWVTASSSTFPHITTGHPLDHRLPDRILLVDDHRFYNRAAEYSAALDAHSLRHDVWTTNERGEIPVEHLLTYDLVFWYTGYDWFAPVTPDERHALMTYLQQGGRLFLSSQDFLFYNHASELARMLGVETYLESMSPAALLPGTLPLISPAHNTMTPLTFSPYKNNADGIIPRSDSEILLWHDAGAPAAIAASGYGRSVLWSVPWETMPAAQQTAALHDAAAWLSDLGSSTIIASPGADTDQHTFTLTLHNSSTAISNSVHLTNTLPITLALVSGSLEGAVANGRTVQWQGVLPPGGSHTVVYQTKGADDVPAGQPLINTAIIHDGNLDFTFQRTAVLWPNAPDYTASQVEIATGEVNSQQHVTVTLTLAHEGPAPAGVVTAMLPRLPDTSLITSTLQASGGRAVATAETISWKVHGPTSAWLQLTAVFTRTLRPQLFWLPVTAVIDDGTTAPVVIGQFIPLHPHRLFFPIVMTPGVLPD